MSDESSVKPNARSLFDPAIHCPLAAGDLGVIAARAGVGKTACLIHFALAEMRKQSPVLHISLDMTVSNVRQRYDQLLDDAGKRGLLDTSDSERMKLERLRHIHTYPQLVFAAPKLAEALAFLRDAMDFRPGLIVVDGYDIERSSADALAALAACAGEHDASIWLTALIHRHEPADETTGLPQPLPDLADSFERILLLVPEDQRVALRQLQGPSSRDDGDALPCRFEPTTNLLLCR